MKKRIGGFTLVELMVSVAIMGVLASVAVPSYSMYVRRAKTSEAPLNLQAMYQGASSYTEREFVVTSTGTGAGFTETLRCIAASSGRLPATPTAATQYPNWETDDTFRHIGFAPTSAVYYGYQLLSSPPAGSGGGGTTAVASAGTGGSGSGGSGTGGSGSGGSGSGGSGAGSSGSGGSGSGMGSSSMDDTADDTTDEGDHDRGHGNDEDCYDEDNPGMSDGCAMGGNTGGMGMKTGTPSTAQAAGPRTTRRRPRRGASPPASDDPNCDLNPGAVYTFSAVGDLDGDGVRSRFEISAGLNDDLELYRSPGIYMEMELE